MFFFRSDSPSGPAQQSNGGVMLIKSGFNIAYNCCDYTPMMLTINIRPEREQDLVQAETITLFPDVPYTNYIDGFGNRCTRLIAPPGRLSIWNRFVIADSGRPEELPIHAYQHQVGELPEDTLNYLVGSRYCDTQKLSQLAWSLFGSCWRGYPLIEAIMNYTHDRLRFSYASARDDRTASDAHEERTGVCRDFAHLAITLLRCMNIPARYCTGYLGDIGVPADPSPMDFSAWLEVYMGGRWWTLDARHNKPRIGRIVMARGRDAADVAISFAFGSAQLVEFQVITEL
jgi:transglutaminase-like putative cysteine protease